MLFGQPGEGGVTARFLLATPAGSGVLENFGAGAGRPGLGAGQAAAGQGTGRQGAAGQGGFGGGFAANLLVGPITAIDGDTVTIETERGAVSAAIDPEGTLLQVLTETPHRGATARRAGHHHRWRGRLGGVGRRRTQPAIDARWALRGRAGRPRLRRLETGYLLRTVRSTSPSARLLIAPVTRSEHAAF